MAECECGTHGFNATDYAAEAAMYLETALVVGANATGIRYFGKFLPSVYCGTNGYSLPTGRRTEADQPYEELILFHINKEFDTEIDLEKIKAIQACKHAL